MEAISDKSETKESTKELYRSECYCGWRGRDRLSPSDAIKDGKEHSKITGHLPPVS